MNPKKTPRLLFGAGLLYFGLLTSSFAQLNNPVTFQITEIPLPINLTEIKKDEQVTLNFCGLLQSPNRQDILAYCYGNAAKQRTEVEKAWMQLLATNDSKLSWLRDQPFNFAYGMAGSRNFNALDDSHHLIISDMHYGLGSVPLEAKLLSNLEETLNDVIFDPAASSIPPSLKTWIYKKNAGEEYFDPQIVLPMTDGSLFALKLNHVKNKDSIYENYNVIRFDSKGNPVWRTLFREGMTYGVIETADAEQEKLLQKNPNQMPDDQFGIFSFVGIWLMRSSFAEPTLIAKADGQSFTYFGATQYDPTKAPIPGKDSFGTRLHCLSPDGKGKFENFLPNAFFGRDAAVFISSGDVYLVNAPAHPYEVNSQETQIPFTFRLVNKECKITQTNQLNVPILRAQPVKGYKAIDASVMADFAGEILQVKTTASGDIIIVYLEQPNDLGAEDDQLLPYQLNVAIFSKDGNLKAAKAIISTDDPNAWYIHKGSGGDYNFPSQYSISVDLKIQADDHSAFISVFNSVLIDENRGNAGYIENILGQDAVWQGKNYQTLPRFFKVSW